MGVGGWGGQMRCWTQRNGREGGQEMTGCDGYCSGRDLKG